MRRHGISGSDGNYVTNLAAAFGAVWATTSHGEELWRIDPESNEPERVGRGNGEGFLVEAGDYIVASHFMGVSFYSGQTGELARTIEYEAGLPHGREPVEALGRLWLNDLTAAQLLVGNLADLEESVMNLGPATDAGPPGAVWWTARAGDSLWTHTAGHLVRIGPNGQLPSNPPTADR